MLMLTEELGRLVAADWVRAVGMAGIVVAVVTEAGWFAGTHIGVEQAMERALVVVTVHCIQVVTAVAAASMVELLMEYFVGTEAAGQPGKQAAVVLIGEVEDWWRLEPGKRLGFGGLIGRLRL